MATWQHGAGFVVPHTTACSVIYMYQSNALPLDLSTLYVRYVHASVITSHKDFGAKSYDLN